MAIKNKGRLNNFISGISGVSPGGTAVVNMPVNLRAHRLNFQTSGQAYGAGGTTVTAVPTATDAGATFTVQTALGVISGITVVGAVSTHGAGSYALTIAGGLYTDARGVSVRLGTGATGTYTVNGSNVVTGATVTNPGTVSAVPPELLVSSFKQTVNGVNMRDIAPLNIQKIPFANPSFGWSPVLGEFSVFFTEPWRNMNQFNETTSWDLAGQNTWQLQIGISTAIGSPALVGSYEFDFERNLRPAMQNGKQVMVPFLQPVRQHQYSFPVGQGRTDITQIPFDYPISRLWVYATDLSTGALLGVGSVTQLELYQDSNKVLESTLAQNQQIISEYGFNPLVFDAAFVSDPDQRLFKALRVENQLILRVYTAQAANINVVVESLPGAYA